MKSVVTLLLTFILSAGFSPSEAGVTDYLVRLLSKSKDTLNVLRTAEQESLSPSKINVLVWNVYKGSEDSFRSDFTKITEGKDIVLVQEAVYDNPMKRLFLSLPEFGWDTATSFRIFYKDFVGTGVATGSNAKTQSAEYIKTVATEPVVGTPKVALFTKYKIKGEKNPLLVVNVHSINFVNDFLYLTELLRLGKKLKKHKGPLILAGDFNTWTPTRMTALKRLVKSLKAKAVPFAKGSVTTKLGQALDHAFVRGFKIINVDNLGYIEGSDHKPLSFELELE